MISPLKGRKDKVKWCMVKHIMKVDWKGWEFLWRKSRNRDMSLIMLERIAGYFFCFYNFCMSACRSS